jgi:hypothetical protein
MRKQGYKQGQGASWQGRYKQEEGRYPRNNRRREGNYSSNKVVCYACGKEGHTSNSSSCPAKGQNCKICNKPNHSEEVCWYHDRNKGKEEGKSWRRNDNPLKKLEQNTVEESEDEDYIFKIGESHHTDVVMKVEDQSMGFLVDTGSGVDAIDKNSFEKIQSKVKIKLYPSKTKIYAYGAKTPLKTEGIFYGNVNYKGTQQICRFHVMSEANSGCVIGRSTATELGMIKIHENINSLRTEDKENIKLKKAYPTVFKGLGKLKGTQLKLNIDETVTPVSQHLRRIPFHVRKKIERKIEQLLQLDIIEKVEDAAPTNWVSPILAIPKGEDIRMVVDMRKANEAIMRTHYPVPTLEELLEKFNNCTVFSKVDLNHGYHQIELHPDSRNITTFITHAGLFRYKRLVQGASSALEEYQHMIGDLFKHESRISNICDDILVAGRNKEEHDCNVKKCLEILETNNLTVNESKCEWNKSEITFYGHTLSENGIRPTKSKVEAIKAFPQPKCRKQVSSFLGMVTYLAKFVPNLSTETEKLRRLLRKDVEWIWGEQEEETFIRLKTLVSSDTVLAHFNAELETSVITDAGAVGVGAILVQKQIDGCLRPVHYSSRTLTQQENKYSQTEKEALGVVWACEKFHLFLYGKPFTILTDHQPLKILYSQAGKPSPRILRWTLRLQSYEFQIKHIPGNINPADMLSNSPMKLDEEEEKNGKEMEVYINKLIAYATPKAITLSEILEESEKDNLLKEVIECLKKDEWPQKEELKQYKQVRNELMYKGGVVLKGESICVPSNLRKRTLKIAHESHLGITKTKALMKEKVWWPNLDKDIEQMIKSCIPCLSMGTPDREPMKHLDLGKSKPYEKVSIDLCGPFPSGEYILGIIDAYSRWPDALITKSTTSKTITKLLVQTFSTHGFPSQITTDNAANLTSAEVKEFCEEYGIKHHRSSPYWPQGNSEVERFYKTIGKMVKTSHAEGKRWQDELPKFLLTYRNTPHCTTKIAPAEMLMNRKLRDKLPSIMKESEYKEKAEAENAKVEARNEKYYNKKKMKKSEVKEGDWVLVKQRKTNKLSTNFNTTPMKVTRVKGSSISLQKGRKEMVRNINDLKVIPVPCRIDYDESS